MAKKAVTIISLRDNYTAVMKKAARYTKAFDKDVQKMVKHLDSTSKKKHDIRVKNSAALKALNAIEKKVAPLRNVAVRVAANISRFKRDMRPVLASNKALLGKAWEISLKLKDGVTAGLKRITGALQKAARVVLIGGGAAAAAAGYTVNKGMELEDYQISMRHFVGVNNPGASESDVQKRTDEYMNWLRGYSNKTPYGTGETVEAGSRAVQIAEGNIKAAQGLVRMAGDMAALTPNKTIMDAMEALADAQMGEMERMKEFGFKMSAEAFKKAGNDLFSTQGVSGMTLEQVFSGGAQKKGKSARGILSTLTGNIESGVQDAGLALVDALKPLMIQLLPQSENISKKIAEMGGLLGGWIADTIPKLSQLWEDLKAFFEPIGAWANEKWDMLKPFRDFIGKAFDGIAGKGENIMSGLAAAIDSLVNTLINALNAIATNWPAIEPAVAGFVKWLPQLLMAFAGFKVLSFGIGVGKAAGSLFSGVGKLFGLGGGKGKPSGSVPKGKPTPPPTKGGKPFGPLPAPTGAFAKPAFPGLNTTALFGGAKAAGLASGATIGLMSAGALSGAYAMYETFLGSKAEETKKNMELARNVTSKTSSGFLGLGGIANAGNVGGFKGLFGTMSNPPEIIPDESISNANAKIDSFTSTASSKIESGLPEWARKLFANGSLTANINFFGFGGGSGYGTSHLQLKAAGIKRIPFDNYPALLHKGEAVLPSGEAGEYRRNGNQSGSSAPNISLTVNVHGANVTAKEIMAEAVRQLNQVALNMS